MNKDLHNRRTGKSTRIIDNAIQALFRYGSIIIPYKFQENLFLEFNLEQVIMDSNVTKYQQENLQERILKRLKREHPFIGVSILNDVVKITKDE